MTFATRLGTTDEIQGDAANWKATLPNPVPIGQVDALSYITRKAGQPGGNAAATIAYLIYLVDTDGVNDDAVLTYEPYWNGTNPPAIGVTYTHNVLAGRFWTNKTIGNPPDGPLFQSPGGPYGALPGQTEADTLQTWAKIVKANPSAKVAAIGTRLGTYNNGVTARFNHVIFKGGKTCVDHTWMALPASSSSVSASASSSSKPPSASASSSSSSKPPSASASSSSSGAAPLPTPGAGGSLPRTGDTTPVALIATGGGAAVLAGVVLLLITLRRRRMEPEFEA
jgi:LPXTG-motif cell wall-anchored protein